MALVPVTILIVLLSYYMHHQTVLEEQKALAADEATSLSLGTVAITKDLRAITTDLMIVAQHTEFWEMHQRLNPDSVWHLQRDLLLLVGNKQIYDQARYLDETGMEIVRVNFNNGRPTAVPSEVLQDKSRRYYFREAMALDKGEIYFSPLDLNIEHGKIERPFKPMIRLATPVFNKEGKKRGVVVLNYFGVDLIGNFETEATGVSGDAMILNSNGYWLKAPDPELEWGFMLDHNQSFAKNSPKSWERIVKADKGQFVDENGLFTFETVYPLLEDFKSATQTTGAFVPSAGKLDRHAYYWKIVSQVPGNTLSAMAERETRKFLFVLGPLYLIVVITVGGLVQVRMRRTEAEKALRESEARMRLLLEAISVGVGIEDLDGRTMSANDGWARVLGYTPEEFLKMQFTEYTHPDHAAEDMGLFKELAEGKRERYQLEKCYISKNGSEVWGRVTRTLVRDDQGNPAYCLGMVEDITERKAVEHQLVQAQKMESVGQLTGGVAHDFNNLLAVVSLNMGLLQDEVAGNPRHEKLVERTLDAVRRGATLTQRLLAFSRRQSLSPRPTDLGGLIADLEGLLRRTVGETIELHIRLAEDVWPVLVDAHQLESAILNVILNARDAMPVRGVLTLETKNTPLDEDFVSGHDELAAGDYVRLAISDTGSGIAPEILEQVIEPFFTTKEVGKGSGLGLSMVYGFSKQSHGHLAIHSKVGEGTTVELYLPRDTSQMPNASAAKNRA